jgi:hypothetical protein
MACQDAPAGNVSAACGPIGSGQTSLAGGPSQSMLNATCGGATYEATCACPEGTCVCFGPSGGTSVVSFAGCPFTPGQGSIGPTTMGQVFALCGFPQ